MRWNKRGVDSPPVPHSLLDLLAALAALRRVELFPRAESASAALERVPRSSEREVAAGSRDGGEGADGRGAEGREHRVRCL